MAEATLLVVEDNGILAMHLQDMLVRSGYRVAGTLACGEEVSAFVATTPVDLILMDIELAGPMNGIAAAEAVHREHDIPIIFLTGFSHDPLLKEAKIVGPYGYLIKPVPERELAATVAMALHRHHLDQQLQQSRLALARSEAQYRHLFENSPIGIFRTTLDGRALAVNAEMARIVGCASPEEALADFTHLTSQLYVHAERREQFLAQLRASGAVQDFEYEGRKKNGERLWISMSAKLTSTSPDSEQAGDTVIDGFATDTTERKRTEEALRKSEKKLRDILDNAISQIWAFDGQCYTYINKAFYQFTGLEPGENLSIAAWKDLVHPDDLPEAGRVWAEAWAARAAHDNYFRLRSRNGEYRDFWCHAVPVFDEDGELSHFQGFNIDITEGKRAERNYQTLFREMLDGFALHEIVVDAEGEPVDYRFLAINPAFERMTGLRAADIVGRTVLEVLPDTELRWIRTYGRVALTGEPAHFDDFTAALGKYFEVTAYRPAPGQFACIFIDVTEKKLAETEKKKLQAQLQQAQKMEAIGTLAGGIAHDFNNILGAVLGYAELAREDSPPGSLAARDIEQVILAGNRAKDLVKQILAFSRQAETEQIVLQPAVIIKETLKMLRSSLPSTIAIRQDLAPDTGAILADPTQIHQILMNLCTNAYHAMEEKGGTLSITLSARDLSQEDLAGQPHAQPGKYVHLAVGDTGQGIAPEIHDRIFDPYFTTKETGKGTGMGLAIVHGIVKSYGGCISCDSRPGQGTVFHITLPLLPDDHPPLESSSNGIIPVGNEHILFIDDEPMLCEMGQAMLQRLGYRVTVRTSSLEALTSFHNQPDAYDLVITDQTMPGMTGIDLARRMLQLRPDLPIILCTGYSSLISEEKAKGMGVRGFALKPLAKGDIAVLIRQVLADPT